MGDTDSEKFHKIYGSKRTRIFYQKRDFMDYVLMIFISAAVLIFVYGESHFLTIAGVTLGLFLIGFFMLRHGVSLRVPLLLKKPQEVLYLFWYKIENMKPMYLLAIVVFVLEKAFIKLTPDLPHNVELMHAIAMYLFFTHFFLIMVYRTIVLVSHLLHKERVKEVLMETTWRGVFRRQSNVTVHILHAYVTGVFTHMVFIAPWYLVISFFDFSLLLAPLIIVVNVVLHMRYMKSYNAWFYRDHWLGHNSEMDFLYLHGAHHDAIPSGLIGVSGNGPLEGLLRHTLGNPMPLYNPIAGFLLYTAEVQQDIKYHQYIPGVFPRLPRDFHGWSQHSTHHFGKLAPYSIGFKNARFGKSQNTNSKFPPREILNSIELDEQLNGFKWDNPTYRHFLEIVDRYEKKDVKS